MFFGDAMVWDMKSIDEWGPGKLWEYHFARDATAVSRSVQRVS